MKSFVAIIAVALSASASAAPVHLSCETRSPNGRLGSMSLTLDESAGIVILNEGDGVSFKLPAQFTQTQVLFKNSNILPGSSLTAVYELDRVAGTVAYSMSKGLVTTGVCVKAAAVVQKF